MFTMGGTKAVTDLLSFLLIEFWLFHTHYSDEEGFSCSSLGAYRAVGHVGETRDLDSVDRGQKQDLTASGSRSEVGGLILG